jgi:hypothetical protein
MEPRRAGGAEFGDEIIGASWLEPGFNVAGSGEGSAGAGSVMLRFLVWLETVANGDADGEDDCRENGTLGGGLDGFRLSGSSSLGRGRG